jgi:hypothetical protein
VCGWLGIGRCGKGLAYVFLDISGVLIVWFDWSIRFESSVDMNEHWNALRMQVALDTL